MTGLGGVMLPQGRRYCTQSYLGKVDHIREKFLNLLYASFVKESAVKNVVKKANAKKKKKEIDKEDSARESYTQEEFLGSDDGASCVFRSEAPRVVSNIGPAPWLNSGGVDLSISDGQHTVKFYYEGTYKNLVQLEYLHQCITDAVEELKENVKRTNELATKYNLEMDDDEDLF